MTGPMRTRQGITRGTGRVRSVGRFHDRFRCFWIRGGAQA